MGETILTALFDREKSGETLAPLLHYENDTYTFQKFNDYTSRLATGLKMIGIEKGSNIGLLMPNIPEFIFSYYGILKSGCTVIPINILSKMDDLTYAVNTADISCIIYWSQFEKNIFECYNDFKHKPKTISTGNSQFLNSDSIQNLIEGNWPASFDPFISYSDPAVIQFTSGTSGSPKSAVLTHKNLHEAAKIIVEAIKLSKEDKVLAALPLFHPFAQSVTLNAAILAGSQIFLHQRFDFDKILHDITTNKITIVGGVPSMLELFLTLPEEKRPRMDSIKCFISSGGKLKTSCLLEVEKIYKKPVLEAYGMAETFFITSMNRLYGIRKPGSVGFPHDKIDIKVLSEESEEVFPDEVGEITVKGITVTNEYYKNPEETKKNIREGWLYTGDMGRIDMDGFLYLIDRKADIINKGGFIVYPKEVEEVIKEHENIDEVAVIGINDRELTQEVKAFVVPKENGAVDPQELIDFCKERLPNYKAPKYIEIVDNLPKNYSGKILKRLLKNLHNKES